MSSTVVMQAPSGVTGIVQASNTGNTYNIDTSGFVTVDPKDVLALITAGFGLVGASGARSNLSATTDPGATDDATKDYAKGSRWVNTSAKREWICIDPTASSAVWMVLEPAASALLLSADTITAHAGGGQGSATQLAAFINRLSVVATGGDSAKLPASVPGLAVVVINDGAAAAQIFGAGTDTIDGVATGTGVVLTNAKRAIYYCATAGAWQSCMGIKSA